MKVQAHMSGELSGQSPIQGTVPQNNGNSQMQNLVVASAGASGGQGPSPSTVVPIDRDILRLRRCMQILVFKVLEQKQPPPGDAASKAKYVEVAKRLEDGLFKMANTKEDYLDQSTLNSRLATLIIGRRLSNQQNANSSPPGTMTTLAPEVSPEITMVREDVPESEDELEIEIAENLESISLYS